MRNFGIIFIIFAIVTFISGLLLYHGHFSKEIFWRSTWKNITKQELKNVGLVTIFTSISILLTGISALFLKEESIIPVLVLVLTLFIIILILRKINVTK